MRIIQFGGINVYNLRECVQIVQNIVNIMRIILLLKNAETRQFSILRVHKFMLCDNIQGVP